PVDAAAARDSPSRSRLGRRSGPARSPSRSPRPFAQASAMWPRVSLPSSPKRAASSAPPTPKESRTRMMARVTAATLWHGFAAVQYYFKAPEDLGDRLVIVVDPMLATANSASAAIRALKERGARDLRLMCLLAAPEGIARLQKAEPDVPIFTAAIDQYLNDHG